MPSYSFSVAAGEIRVAHADAPRSGSEAAQLRAAGVAYFPVHDTKTFVDVLRRDREARGTSIFEAPRPAIDRDRRGSIEAPWLRSRQTLFSMRDSGAVAAKVAFPDLSQFRTGGYGGMAVALLFRDDRLRHVDPPDQNDETGEQRINGPTLSIQPT